MRHSVSHYLLPHESNNYKPRTLHFSALLFYIVIFLLLQTSFRVIKNAHPEILGFATNINVEQLLNLTNLKRAEAGLPPLTLDSELSQAAKFKADDMFSKNYWAHNAPDGTMPWFFINSAGYSYIYAGENLAKDFNDSSGVVDAWMNSPSHKDNLLKKEYQDIGFAVVNGKLAGEETTLVVQLFGTRQGVSVAAKPVEVSETAASINNTPVPSVTPNVTPQPESSTAGNVIKSSVLSSLNANFLNMGVYRKPLINYFSTTKNIATVLTLGLLLLLIVDGIYIWRRKIVRISGHNLAHVIFLAGLLGALWVTSQGVVL